MTSDRKFYHIDSRHVLILSFVYRLNQYWVLQELSTIVPAREKQTIVKTAISKFRAAIKLQFDFHRAVYNLGTVLVSLQ